MGLTIKLQDERGEVIEKMNDPKDLLGPYVEVAAGDQSYKCVRFIDRYGDTYFNRPQIETFLSEWDQLQGCITEETAELKEEVRRMFVRVKDLAQQVGKEPHLYLKFEGD